MVRYTAIEIDVPVDATDPGITQQAVLDFLRSDVRPTERWQYALVELRGPLYVPASPRWSLMFDEIRVFDDDGMDLVEPTEV